MSTSRKSRKSTVTPVRKLVLRVRSVMVDRGFRSVSALQRSLAAIGVAISVPQLIRVVDGDAKHLNKDVIEGLLTVFDCGIGDLFAVR
jgi:Cro/C1-type HTH DNA-binding domain